MQLPYFTPAVTPFVVQYKRSYFFEHRITMGLLPKYAMHNAWPQTTTQSLYLRLLWGPDGGTWAGIGGCGAGVDINL